MTTLKRRPRFMSFVAILVVLLAALVAVLWPGLVAEGRTSRAVPLPTLGMSLAPGAALDDAALLGIFDQAPVAAAGAPAPQTQGWLQWQDLGGTITSAPTAVSWGTGRIDVFARGGTGEVVQSFRETGQWAPWTTPGELRGVILRSAPSCASWSRGTINCVALREGYGGVFQFWWDGQRWSRNDLGGDASSAPSLVAWGNNRLSVFVRNFNGNVIHRYWQANVSDWSPPNWEVVGVGTVVSAPACTSRANGIIDCFALGTGGLVQQLYYDESSSTGTRWTGWQQLNIMGFRGTSTLAAVGWNRDLLDIFVRGTDMRLYQITYNRQWSQTWQTMDTRPLLAAPGCARVGTDRIDCFAQLLDVASQAATAMNVAPGLAYTSAQRR